MRIIVACEYSGIVRDAFIDKGHDAVSCDIIDTESPGPHITSDIRDVDLSIYDMMIAHPPCTYLTSSAAWALQDDPTIMGKKRNVSPETLIGSKRRAAQKEALDMVMFLWESNVERICIENPVGAVSSMLGKPQYVQPYQFGDDKSKKTGLWLKGLSPLVPTDLVGPAYVQYRGRTVKRWSNQSPCGADKTPPSKDRGKIRSSFPLGIAKAMAKQWG